MEVEGGLKGGGGLVRSIISLTLFLSERHILPRK